MTSLMRLRLLVAALLFVAPAVSAAPKAGKGAAPACGIKLVPFVTGNVWTYKRVPAPIETPKSLEKLAPRQPDQIVVTVTSVETKGTDTVIALEEKMTYNLSTDTAKPKPSERTVASSITCTAKGRFDISPESFFFAGEPGGYIGMTIENVERNKGQTSIVLTGGGIGENQWLEEIKGKWTQVPAKDSNATLGTGTFQLERKFTPQEKETVVTGMGQYSAEKLAIMTSGRVFLDAPKGKPDPTTGQHKPQELPAEWGVSGSTIWIADGVGIVQTLNPYMHQYQLVDANLK